MRPYQSPSLAIAGPVWIPTRTGGKPALAAELLDQPQPEQDRRAGLGAAQHQPVADRLDLLGRVLLEHPAHAALETQRHLERAVVALELGQRREAD